MRCARLFLTTYRQGERRRSAPETFISWQGINREEEDAHYSRRYQNQFRRQGLVEDAVNVVVHDTLDALEEELEDWIEEAVNETISGGPRIVGRHLKKNLADKERHVLRNEARANKKAKHIARWQAWGDSIFLTYSWNQRKDRCILAFTEAYSLTGKLTEGYNSGAKAARVCEKTAWSWITAFEANEGFHDLLEWGKHSSVPHILDDEDIKAQCLDWINLHEPRRGRAGFTALQFCIFLVGDQRQDPPTAGILTDILFEQERKTICERTANSYLHRLGRHYDWLKPGTFSDRHEDFTGDRNDRFLPKEQWYFDHGPNFFHDTNGEWHSIESVENYTEAFFNNPKFFHNVLGGDNKARRINLGGQFHPDNKGPYCMYYSHDESCFPACEVRQKGWQGEKQIVRDKKRPSQLHASSRVCRYGNGTLCSEPNDPPGFIWLKGPNGLEAWYKKYNAGEDVPLPPFTDVFMNPGHSVSKDGYWMGVQFRMQSLLALVTFKNVFRAIVPDGYVLEGSALDLPMEFLFVDQLDWSQNHAELHKEALDAQKMNCSPGGQQPHLKFTHHLPDPTKLPYPRWIECVPGCQTCQKDFAEHGHEPGFQTTGQKGLWQVLKERHAFNPDDKMPDCVKRLQQFEDFQIRMGGENSIVYDMYEKCGYAHAFFGVKYHAELAAIERKWMYLKQQIRGLLDGSIPTLRGLLAEYWPRYGVLSCRKDCRHVRETGEVYKQMGSNPNLAALEVGQHEYKGHRRVFDSVLGMFRAEYAANKMTLESLLQAARTKTARIQKKESIEWRNESEKDLKAFRKRRARLVKSENIRRCIMTLIITIKLH